MADEGRALSQSQPPVMYMFLEAELVILQGESGLLFVRGMP
jgi:hypothetical protein